MKIIFAIGIIFFLGVITLQSMLYGKDNTFTVSVVDAATGNPIKNATLTIFPSTTLATDPALAGGGRFIYSMNAFTVEMMIAKAKGYHTKLNIDYFLPFKEHVIYMTKVEEKKKEMNNETKNQPTEENKKENIELNLIKK